MTGSEKVSLVGTAVGVVPQISPLFFHLCICVVIGVLVTLIIIIPQPLASMIRILNVCVFTLQSLAEGIWRLFCLLVHYLSIGLQKLDIALHKLNKSI